MPAIGNYIGIGKRGGGTSWSSYWTTLISATVERVSPTNVILTFPTAKSLVASDFTIAGRTISSASWAGSVLTLVMSTAFVGGDTQLVVTFVKSGGTINVTDNVTYVELTTYITGLATPLSSGQRGLLNTLIGELKTGLSITNLSDVFDTFYVLAGSTSESSLKNLVKNAHHCTAVGSPTFTALEGFTAATNKYLDTNYNPATQGVRFTQNDASMGIYSRTNSAVACDDMGSHDGGTASCKMVLKYTNNTGYFVLNNNDGTSVDFTVSDTRGLFIVTRNAAAITGAFVYDNLMTNTHRTGVGVSVAPISLNIYIGCSNTNGVASAFSTRQFAFAFNGKYITPSMRYIIMIACENYMIANGKASIPVGYVAFGDSVTVQYNASDAAHRYVNIIATAKGYTLINSGISATLLQNTVQNSVATLGAASNNNGRDTYVARINAYGPKYVTILYGLNDIQLNDVAITSALFENDLGEIIDGIVANGLPAQNIIIGSPSYMNNYAQAAPYNGGSIAKHQAIVAKCLAVATAKGTKYIDVYQYMIDNGGDALVDADGVHPNDSGHAQIAAAFLSVM